MKSKAGFISIYSFSHFIVDFVCAIFILGYLPNIANSSSELVNSVVVYNFFAFVSQVPMGYIFDRFKIYKYVAIIGFCFIGMCYLININNAFIAATVVGIGNALFHLEGGVNIYGISKGKAFLNGLFVAPGALGLFLGTTFHNELVTTYLPLVLIMVAIVLLLIVQRQEFDNEIKNDIPMNINKSSFFLIVLLIGLSIVVRAIGGNAIVYTWKSGFVLGLIYTIAVVIGKAFGGLVADKFGFIKVASISLALSAICLVLGYNIHVLAYIGIFLFNIPMSITLTIMENTMSKKIACAVGLNTMFLFIGYLICFINITINNNFILTSSIVLAILSIYFAQKLYLKGGFENEND